MRGQRHRAVVQVSAQLSANTLGSRQWAGAVIRGMHGRHSRSRLFWVGFASVETKGVFASMEIKGIPNCLLSPVRCKPCHVSAWTQF